jgi:hypothetical protein
MCYVGILHYVFTQLQLSIYLRLALVIKLLYTTNHLYVKREMYLRAKRKYFHHVL